jgi:Phospholipase A2
VKLFSLSVAFSAFVFLNSVAEAQKIDLEDCSHKPILGFYFAQSLPQAGVEFSIESGKDLDPSKITFEIYGNWCGPNHPRTGLFPKPYDKLDALCKAHDQCYEKSGYSDCVCDKVLIYSIAAAQALKSDYVKCRRNKKPSREQNPFYQIIKGHFEVEYKKRGCLTLDKSK